MRIALLMLLAAVVNSLFGIFWKKAIVMVSPSIFLMTLGSLAVVGGVVSALLDGAEIKTGLANLWPLPLSVIFVVIFYFVYSKLLTTEDISKAYPILSISTLLIITLAGLVFFKEPLTAKKVAGVACGIASIWLIVGK